MIFVGIDPGLTGGMAAIDHTGIPLYVEAFHAEGGEFNPHAFADMLIELRHQMPAYSNAMTVGLEKVHAMPKQGVSSTFKFGNTFGKIQGVLAAKSIPFELITPQMWTKELFKTVEGEGKERGRILAQRLFPSLELRASARSRKVHSGMADALLIAEFLRRRAG